MAELGGQEFGVEIGTYPFPSNEVGFFGNFRLKYSSIHEGLGFQLISFDRKGDRISVELRASKWGSDSTSASNKQYRDAADEIVRPLLRSFNKAMGTSYRLRVTEARYGPIPTKRTLKYLDVFCNSANKSILHPLDWARFYDFVKQSRQLLNEETLEALLRERGFSGLQARHIATIYNHLVEFRLRHK